MLYEFQDPKYQIEVVSVQKPGATEGTTHTIARLVNRASGKPIPEDEPVFILRGQDRVASQGIADYGRALERYDGAIRPMPIEHDVWTRYEEFERFAVNHPERMKTPD